MYISGVYQSASMVVRGSVFRPWEETVSVPVFIKLEPTEPVHTTRTTPPPENLYTSIPPVIIKPEEPSSPPSTPHPQEFVV